MVRGNNPAGRLYILLDKVRKSDTTHQAVLVWGEVLDLKDQPEHLIVRRFLQVEQLFRETKAALESLEGLNRELYLGEMHHIETALYPSTLFRSWREVKQSLTDTAMQRLAFCAEKLAELPQSRDLEASLLSDLQRDVENLSRRIIEADELDEEAKEVLVEVLEILRSALIEYQIRGPERLREALEAAIGKLAVNHSKVERGKGSVVEPEFGSVFSRFATIVGLVSDAYQLGPAAIDLVSGFLPS